MRWTPDQEVWVRALAGALCCVLGQDLEFETVILYYINHGSPWFNNTAKAEGWLMEQEKKQLDQKKDLQQNGNLKAFSMLI